MFSLIVLPQTPLTMSDSKKPLRSQAWFGQRNKSGFIYRSWLKNQGHPNDSFTGRPVIGICNTWSDLTPCNAHFRDLAEWVKRGVYEAGGMPLEFPVMSLGEPLMRPTAMLFRNLASMDVEESIRANPLDGIVLLTGCDKTTPATLMGAASVDLPTIVVSGGPMLNGKYEGREIGSGTDLWKFSEDLRCDRMSYEEFQNAESCMARSIGHCMTMGTASTMACMVEALGLTLPGGAAIPAADSRRRRLAQLSGRRIVTMVQEDTLLSKIVTRASLENAIMVNASIGGSTNFIVHLLAIAGRLGLPLSLNDFDQLGSKLPLLLNLMPSGEFLMEDFFYAGGLPAVIRELLPKLHQEVLTVNGKSVKENNQHAECYNSKVIRSADDPVVAEAGIAVLRGNLCESGAIIKPSAASPTLMNHRGRAVVFENIDDYHRRIDDPDLEIDASSVMVLKNVGPKGYPGMAEVGNMGLPKKLLDQGVRDMVRISDGRMSGTAFGTVVLHGAPEAAVGGNLALVRDGDFITLNVSKRQLSLDISEAELQSRRRQWKPAPPHASRGYLSLFLKEVEQADTGVDFTFLKGGSGSAAPRDSH